MLQVIKAEEVRDGEPRWWFVAKEDADASLFDRGWGAESLHTADRVAFKTAHGWTPRFAIVDRPAPTPPSAPGLDLDAVEAAERAMTLGEWRTVNRKSFTVDMNGENPERVEWVDFGHHPTDADLAGIVALRNAAPALIAEVRALRAAIAEVRDLIGSTEHESTCAIGPYNAEQNGADCSCTVGTIAAALEAL